MTKCSPSKCRSKTSFFYKVLVSIKQLQSTKKFCNGVSQADIAKFMEKNDYLSGDTTSQLDNALCVAESSRFIIKRKKLYLLVSPAANLHLIPEPCVKNKLEEIQRSFDAAQCPVENKGSNCTRQSKRLDSQTASKSDNNAKRKRRSSRSSSRSRSRSKSSTRSKSRSASPRGRKTRRRTRANGPCQLGPQVSPSRSKLPSKKTNKPCIKKSSCSEMDSGIADDCACGSDSGSSVN